MIENKVWSNNPNQFVIGADEVGRGSFAGPIVGAAVKINKSHEDLLIELKKRIDNGESVSNIARAHSEDTISASSGGDLGWATSGTYVPEFEDKIDTLEINKVSEPFLTQFGWHILEVLSKRDQDNTEVVKMNLAKRYITSSRADEVVDAWLIKLKEKNYIRYVSENTSKKNINKKNNKKRKDSWDPFS